MASSALCKGQSEPGSAPKIVVLGVGNILLKDEGIGVHAANALRVKLSSDHDNVEILDVGTSTDVLLMLEDVDKLIIIDALKGNGEPGAVYRVRPEQLKLDHDATLSLHNVGVLEGLHMVQLAGRGPKETVIIGVEPEKIDWGLDLSPRLQQKIDQIMELVIAEIDIADSK